MQCAIQKPGLWRGCFRDLRVRPADCYTSCGQKSGCFQRVCPKCPPPTHKWAGLSPPILLLEAGGSLFWGEGQVEVAPGAHRPAGPTSSSTTGAALPSACRSRARSAPSRTNRCTGMGGRAGGRGPAFREGGNSVGQFWPCFFDSKSQMPIFRRQS